jgi:type I restriction enzyme R subunit
VVTTKLFEDADLSHTMASGNWKQMPDLHPEVKKRIGGLLVPLAGWQRSVARDHAGHILTILLKN